MRAELARGDEEAARDELAIAARLEDEEGPIADGLARDRYDRALRLLLAGANAEALEVFDEAMRHNAHPLLLSMARADLADVRRDVPALADSISLAMRRLSP